MKKGKGRAASSPIWLTRDLLDTIHTDLVEQYGGLHGIADGGLIDSAMACPQNELVYRPKSDLCGLAASLGYGLAKNHGYRDGNKRTAFMAMAVFLHLNGIWLDAPEPEAVAAKICVATDVWDESTLGDWLRRSSRPAP